MRTTLIVLSLLTFVTLASIDPAPDTTPVALVGWGVLIIASLSVLGMSLKETNNEKETSK